MEREAQLRQEQERQRQENAERIHLEEKRVSGEWFFCLLYVAYRVGNQRAAETAKRLARLREEEERKQFLKERENDYKLQRVSAVFNENSLPYANHPLRTPPSDPSTLKHGMLEPQETVMRSLLC